MLVDVGNDSGWVSGHYGVDVGFDQGAGVKLLVAQALRELPLLCLNLLVSGVVGAYQKIADNVTLRVVQGRDRHHCRKAAAILADIGQLVDVLDTTRCLEHQGLKAWLYLCFEIFAQLLCTCDYLLRIRHVSRCDLIYYFGCHVAQHLFGTDVEDLDNPIGVGCDT